MNVIESVPAEFLISFNCILHLKNVFINLLYSCFSELHILILCLRYADDTTLMAESEEELKSLLMKVKVESEKVGSTFRKRRSWLPVPSLHGK